MESEKKVATWGGRLFSKEVEKLIDEDRIKEARQLWLDELENFLKSPETVGQIQNFFLFFLEELKKKYSIEERLRLGKWEESEKILSWREMQFGVYKYHGIEHRGTFACASQKNFFCPIKITT